MRFRVLMILDRVRNVTGTEGLGVTQDVGTGGRNGDARGNIGSMRSNGTKFQADLEQ